MKRCYYVQGEDESWGWAIVASSAKEAKRLGYKLDGLEDFDFIEITVSWLRNAKVDDLEIGTVIEDLIDGLKRGCYDFVEYICPECGHEDHLELRSNEKVMCDTCWEEARERNNIIVSEVE